MARRFIIADPSDDVQLMLSQYISMGWHDAEVEEATLDDLLAAEQIKADAIIIGDTTRNDPAFDKLMEKGREGKMPPTILINNEEINEEGEASMLVHTLSMEDLTPVLLNGVITEAMRLHANHAPAKKTTKKPRKEAATADDDHEIEQLEGLKNYHVIRELGRGGMSRVMLADSLDEGIKVAIKVLDTSTTEDERMIERFIREYTILASVNNPHVVTIHDQTFTDTHAYIIMDYFPGGDLTKRIRKGIPGSAAIDYLEQIADGLRAVHKEGIVHRDLKPGNILFRDNNNLALVDFGLAQVSDDDESLTRHGEVYGTPSYVSPEQARGRDLDQRSDIYSTGIIFYQMLTRKKPYRADNPMAMFYKHVHAALPKLPDKHKAYQPLLDSMLAKDPDDRLQSAQELIDALQDYKKK